MVLFVTIFVSSYVLLFSYSSIRRMYTFVVLLVMISCFGIELL